MGKILQWLGAIAAIFGGGWLMAKKNSKEKAKIKKQEIENDVEKVEEIVDDSSLSDLVDSANKRNGAE